MLACTVRASPSSSSSSSFTSLQLHSSSSSIRLWGLRGGEESSITPTIDDKTEELTLEEKVQNAMRKLGLHVPETTTTTSDTTTMDSCVDDGVCSMPNPPIGDNEEQRTENKEENQPTPPKRHIFNKQHTEDAHTMAARIANDMGVEKDLAMAALGATSSSLESGNGDDGRSLNEESARAMIQDELDAVGAIKEDSPEVQQLVSEGHGVFLARRALAFVEMNVEDARAILVADQMDAQDEAEAALQMDEEEQARAHLRAEAAVEKTKPKPFQMKTVSVNSDFDPTQPVGPPVGPSTIKAGSTAAAPSPAKKEDVIFDCTAAQIQELILESPVPVLVDCWASWCGPCMSLKPLLEEMTIKAGGMFRLVKINSDDERAVMGALEVTSLPTVFGMKDGQILNSFKGMPRGEEMMKNFMMGLLIPGATFEPALSETEVKKYAELTNKLAKIAGTATFSFSARERLQDQMSAKLDALVAAHGGNFADAEDSAKVIRSLLSNIIRNPYDEKFRKLNLQNTVVAAKVASFPPAVSILKGIGFSTDGTGNNMIIGKGKKVVNVAPLSVARDCIDKWIDKSRHDVATAMRKRKDMAERDRLLREGAFDKIEEEDDDEVEEVVDPNITTIKVRMEGKKKVQDVVLLADQSLMSIMDKLPVSIRDDTNDFQITCAAKRLVIKSSNVEAMKKSFRDHGLYPAASIVIKIGTAHSGNGESSSTNNSSTTLKERAAAKKTKKGSHTMQTTGIYGKDDGLKGELVDGGGGTVYEQDVTDDEVDGADDDDDDDKAPDGDHNEDEATIEE